MNRKGIPAARMNVAEARERIEASGLKVVNSTAGRGRYNVAESDGTPVKSLLKAAELIRFARTRPAPVQAQDTQAAPPPEVGGGDIPPGSKCSECGGDHSGQRTDFPEGAPVVVITEFDNFALGTLGTVGGHCDDGRAYVHFDGDSAGHTFHFPADFIAVGKLKGDRPRVAARSTTQIPAAASPGVGGTFRLPCLLTITKVSGNMQIPRPVYIELSDAFSGVQFATAEVSLESFARAALGHTEEVCEIEVVPDVPFGKVVEQKTEILPRSNYTSTTEDDRDLLAARAVASYEVDGWKARKSDYWNSNNWTRDGNGVRVFFSRFVEPTAEQIAAVRARLERRSKSAD